MPTNKDLKRRIRARMDKTGESYTTARARLLARKGPPAARTTSPDALAERAGMSDDAVAAKTGRPWAGWVEMLDAIDADGLAHRDVAAWLRDEHGLSSWWAQTVTVGYERIRGLRQVGQRHGGSWEATRSRTFPVPVERLYDAFAHARQRRRWLPDADIDVRHCRRPRSVRWTWADGTPVEATFVAKGPSKSTVQVQHGGLPSKQAFKRAKEAWGVRLTTLGKALG